MKGWSVSVVLALVGLLAGGAAGWALRPPAPPPPEPGSELAAPGAVTATPPAPRTRPEDPRDYVRLNNQFVVPVLTGGHVEAFIILALSLEVMPGTTDTLMSVRRAAMRMVLS